MDYFEDSSTNIDNKILEFNILKAKNVKIGHCIEINNYPCKVINIKTKQTKKAGNPDFVFTGICYVTNEQFELRLSYNSTINSPILKKSVYILTSIDRDNYVTVIDLTGTIKSYLKMCYETDNDLKINKKLKLVNFKTHDVLISVLSVLNYDKIVNIEIKIKKAM